MSPHPLYCPTVFFPTTPFFLFLGLEVYAILGWTLMVHRFWLRRMKWKVEIANSAFQAKDLCCVVRHNITAAVGTETLSNCGRAGRDTDLVTMRSGVVLLFPNWPFTWGAWAMSSPPSCPIVGRSKEHSRQNSQKLGGQISLFLLVKVTKTSYTWPIVNFGIYLDKKQRYQNWPYLGNWEKWLYCDVWC